MTIKQHIHMTASEIAMGRYMRAPDHSPADEFAAAFDNLAAADDKGGAPAAAAEGEGNGSGEGTGAAAGAEAAGGDGGSGGAGADDGAGAAAAAAEGGAAGEGEAGAAAGGEGSAAAGGEGAGEAGAGAEGAAAGAAGDKSAGGGGGAGGNAKPAGEPAKVPDADELLDRLAAKVAERAPAAEQGGAAAAQEQPLYTEDEAKVLAKFEDEWPEVKQAFELQQRAITRSVIGYVFQEIRKEFDPIADAVEALVGRAHVTELKDKVGEYTDAERNDIITWAKTQPTYLQKAYNDVIESGSPEEVADLVGRYREAKGIVPAGEPAPKPQGGDTELSGAAKQAADKLAPVRSKQSVVSAPDDPSNFDAAWAKFATADMNV
jgi:hypothetical protein